VPVAFRAQAGQDPQRACRLPAFVASGELQHLKPGAVTKGVAAILPAQAHARSERRRNLSISC
jgi:hypothetical protein